MGDCSVSVCCLVLFVMAMASFSQTQGHASMASETEDQTIKEIFMMFDEDCDDQIETKELRAVLKFFFKETDETLHTLMAKFDTDGSGAIELNEFKEMYRSLPKKPKAKCLRQLFDKYDTNGDGDLEKVEVKRFISELLQEVDDELIDKLFRETDKDGNEKINFREFCLMFGKSIRDTTS